MVIDFIIDKLPTKATLVTCLIVSGSAFAGSEVTEIRVSDWPTGSVGLGGGLRVARNPFPAGGDAQIDLIPLLLYNGRYLFSRGTSGGVHIVNRPGLELNALARVRYERLNPDDSVFYEGIEPRRPSVDGGAELRVRGDWGEIQTAWLTDTLNRHKGESIELSYRYKLEIGRLTLSPFVGWERQNDELTNYYYGVGSTEARPGRPAYAPGSSQWFSLGLNATYAPSDRALFFGNIGFSSVDPAVTSSPIVGANATAEIYLGGTYLFGNLHEPLYFSVPERASEWSWRVNYGYSADGNIVGEIDQGNFRKSELAETTIGGFTVGKLLASGPSADLSGRFALFRHLEADQGFTDFNSYALYLMASGKGFKGWSHGDWFRWGFGFGLSYAEEVPLVEQLKQQPEGENNSRLLAYLEMQLDYPLRRLFKAESVRNCYAGITIVHRSGIFGSSDVLGDVSGGADWITAHLECSRR